MATQVTNYYHVVGQDGQEYGPLTFEMLQSCVSDGRVAAQTYIRLSTEPSWSRAGERPELQFLFQPQMPMQRPPMAAPSPASMPLKKPETQSVRRTTSMVLPVVYPDAGTSAQRSKSTRNIPVSAAPGRIMSSRDALTAPSAQGRVMSSRDALSAPSVKSSTNRNLINPVVAKKVSQNVSKTSQPISLESIGLRRQTQSLSIPFPQASSMMDGTGEVQAEGAFPSQAVARPQTYWDAAVNAFTYPFQGQSLGFIFFMGILFAASKTLDQLLHENAKAAVTLNFLCFGFLSIYIFEIVKNTLRGEDQPPGHPRDFSMSRHVIRPLYYGLMTQIVSFLPLFVIGLVGYIVSKVNILTIPAEIIEAYDLKGYSFVEAFKKDLNGPQQLWGGLALAAVVWAGIYGPMSFLAMVIYKDLRALLPQHILPVIFRTQNQYVVPLLTSWFATLFVVGWPMTMQKLNFFKGNLMVGMGMMLIINLLGYLIICISGRMLGLLYRFQKENLKIELTKEEAVEKEVEEEVEE